MVIKDDEARKKGNIKVIARKAAILLSIKGESTTQNDSKCYVARICIHNGVEKCGVDSKGNNRRFFDSCDMLEYNCLYNTDFSKESKSKCEKLPPIPPEIKEMKRKGTHKH